MIMNIQPANKVVKHLINSYDWYWRRKQKQSVRKSGGGGGGVTLASSSKDWAEFYGCIVK